MIVYCQQESYKFVRSRIQELTQAFAVQRVIDFENFSIYFLGVAKTELNDELIPDIHTRSSLIALADYFEAVSRQIRFAAEETGDNAIDVVGTPTLRIGRKYLRNWLGNLVQSVSSISLEKAAKPKSEKDQRIEDADREAAHILSQAKHIKTELKNLDKSRKKA